MRHQITEPSTGIASPHSPLDYVIHQPPEAITNSHSLAALQVLHVRLTRPL